MDQPVGYRQLLRENKAVRSVWLSQIFGQSGDWLNLIALFTLVGRGTEPATAIAVILSLHYLCPFFWGSLAGMAADRFNRRTILIVSDAIRIPTVLGFIWLYNCHCGSFQSDHSRRIGLHPEYSNTQGPSTLGVPWAHLRT